MSFPGAERVALPDRGFGPIELSVHSAGSGPAVVFSHGFPELAYTWRHQLAAVAGAGFQAIAPDQRGYGNSAAPEPVEAYDIEALCGDLADLCAARDIDHAVFVGHDWGGAVVWAMPSLHPELVAGVVGICTPMMAFPGTDFLRMLVDGVVERQYMLWFQEPGVAEAVMDPRVRTLFTKLTRGGVDPMLVMERAMASGVLDMNPFRDLDAMEPLGEPIMTAADLEVYIQAFERTGFRGGINWYRNIDRNATRHPEIARTDPGVPCLMITAEWDPALPPALAANMVNQIADLETHLIPRAGHWVQQEFPEQVNEVLTDWLRRRFG